jgi:hypothetical protein
VIIAAWFFFGEARYHVPYDPFVVVLAIAGAYEAWRRMRHGIRRAARWVRRRGARGGEASAVVAE